MTTAPRRRSRKGPLVLLLAVLLVASLGVGAWWFGWARYTTTPGVLGLAEAAAVERLDSAGLDVETGEAAFSETVPVGTVVSTEPGPGGRVLDGGTVTLVLSLGPERYDVPRLRGLTEDAAQDALAETSLDFGESSEKWSEKVPAGQVMASSPAAGTTLKPGASVDLVVSKGRRPIEVRDFTGASFDKAQTWLERKKLVGDVTAEEFSDTVPEGDVISQTPTSGTLYRGDSVQLVVSKGPELVEVPQVRAWGIEAARKELESLGFEVVEEESGSYIGVGFVFNTDPPAGSMAPKGSTITVYLI